MSTKTKSKRSKSVNKNRERSWKYSISEDRILQISNDISEDMCIAKPKELIEVVKYFRDNFDAVWCARQTERTQIDVALLTMALEPIFSGEGSRGMWDEINEAKTIFQLRWALYGVAVKCGELESMMRRLCNKPQSAPDLLT
jgi:hypothetical protein